MGFLADDFPGARFRPVVRVGQRVSRGDPLCRDRSNPAVPFTATAAGTVAEIHLGARRALRSIVIELTDEERATPSGGLEWPGPESSPLPSPGRLDGRGVRGLLLESGLWPALRGRPFGRVPSPDQKPAALFVNAMDSNPGAPDPGAVLADETASFDLGLSLLARLTPGPTFVCVRAGSPLVDGRPGEVRVEQFEGPHPAGTAGFHVHTLAPAGRQRTVWTIGYQDVAALGRLSTTGYRDFERVVALGGPGIEKPRLVRTRLGATTSELLADASLDGDVRVISGSVFSGKKAMGPVYGFLGRYDVQLTLLAEARGRVFLKWLRPGVRTFSSLPVQVSKFLPRPRYAFSTSTHGARRPLVPIGAYERVVPFDMLPTFLLRALLVEDDETAERLGCLELVEEDVALCSFVDPSKTDFGLLLRAALDRLERGR